LQKAGAGDSRTEGRVRRMLGVPIDGDGKPNRQALSRRPGGYSRVPARFDQAMAHFHQRRR
jgi:hypothetical protein